MLQDRSTTALQKLRCGGDRISNGGCGPELLDQIPQGSKIGIVTVDRLYDSQLCHTAIIESQATAIIPIRRNGRP